MVSLTNFLAVEADTLNSTINRNCITVRCRQHAMAFQFLYKHLPSILLMDVDLIPIQLEGTCLTKENKFKDRCILKNLKESLKFYSKVWLP